MDAGSALGVGEPSHAGSLCPGPREDLGKEMRSACRGHPGSQQKGGRSRLFLRRKHLPGRGREKAVMADGPKRMGF